LAALFVSGDGETARVREPARHGAEGPDRRRAPGADFRYIV